MHSAKNHNEKQLTLIDVSKFSYSNKKYDFENRFSFIDLFAGIGGFRLGLEGYKGKSSTSNYEKPIKSNFKIKWSNQWEPLTKTQHANFVYKNKWPKSEHSEENIEYVIEKKWKSIPDHDLLVGGFPCQDYSVTTTLKNSKGLGKVFLVEHL